MQSISLIGICNCTNGKAGSPSVCCVSLKMQVISGGLGAGGWGQWALERASLGSVAVTHFDNTEGKDEHKLVQEQECEIWSSRLMERRQQRAQMRWAHHDNYPSCLWWPTKPIKSLEKSWFTIITLSQGKGTKAQHPRLEHWWRELMVASRASRQSVVPYVIESQENRCFVVVITVRS